MFPLASVTHPYRRIPLHAPVVPEDERLEGAGGCRLRQRLPRPERGGRLEIHREHVGMFGVERRIEAVPLDVEYLISCRRHLGFLHFLETTTSVREI
jgi:hypothetical protein